MRSATSLPPTTGRAAQGRRRPIARSASNKAVAEVLDLDVERKPDRARVNSLLRVWIKNGALRKVEQQVEHRHVKTFVEGGNMGDLIACAARPPVAAPRISAATKVPQWRIGKTKKETVRSGAAPRRLECRCWGSVGMT
jgi:hypothetical protein